MLRPKRQHSNYHHSHGSSEDHGGAIADDELMRMNPSLMTERQQLAFLLRKTAQEASGNSDTALTQSSESSEDEVATPRGTTRRIRRMCLLSFLNACLLCVCFYVLSVVAVFVTDRLRLVANNVGNAKSSPRNVGSATAAALGKGVVIYCGRGRPPKNSIKLPPGQSNEEYKRLMSPKSVLTAAATMKKEQDDARRSATNQGMHPPHPKKLKVKTTASPSKKEKTSPSSSSDVLHMDRFESDGATHSGGDFWSLHCALCCNSNAANAYDTSFADALFLCPSCDQKYPTQRALGRV